MKRIEDLKDYAISRFNESREWCWADVMIWREMVDVVEAAKKQFTCTCGYSECDFCIQSTARLEKALKELEKS